MKQNTCKKEIVLIEAEIDCSMQRIAQLLKLIGNSQKLAHLHMKQSQANDDEQLNQTYHSTDYNTTGTNMFYHFMAIDQQILLDGYSSENTYTQQIRIDDPKQMIVSTKSNWIGCFLDCKDANVKFSHQDELIKLLNVQKGVFNCIHPNSGLLTISSSQIYAKENLTVQFPKHLRGFQLNFKVQVQKMLYQFTLQQKSRILFECLNNGSHLIRFLLIKEDEDYSIVWGSYSQQSIFQSLILQAGTYIILPLSENINFCTLYCELQTSIVIKRQQQSPFKTFNLLKRLFQECKQSLGLKRSQSLVSDSQEDTKKQYIRSCYMNYGIIVQIYYNIFEDECRFVDECQQREDKQLLFQEIYDESQINNILCPVQQLIKFFIINKKPANLFVPHKKVFLGNKAVQNITYHNVFK